MNAGLVTFPALERPAALADDLAVAALSLARRFAAGGTMWCVAPRWPEHGGHVAVEFVHPVVVGKRALPAVHVEASDLISTLRSLARPADIAMAVGPGGDPEIAALLRRAGTWGLTRVWLGAGPRPPAGCADHVIWVDGPASELAARSGDLVLCYHLLWELTHVVFEHPGLVEHDDPAALCGTGTCVTCADEALLGEVWRPGDGVAAQVMVGGRLQTVDVSLLDPLDCGDLILVHAGVGLAAIDGNVP
jgi:hypothetical protein